MNFISVTRKHWFTCWKVNKINQKWQKFSISITTNISNFPRIAWNGDLGHAESISPVRLSVGFHQYHLNRNSMHIRASYFSEFPIGIIRESGHLIEEKLYFQVRSQYILCKRRRVPMLTYPISMKMALEEGPPVLRWLAPFAMWVTWNKLYLNCVWTIWAHSIREQQQQRSGLIAISKKYCVQLKVSID